MSGGAWPKLTVWNPRLGAIETLDLNANAIASRVALGDDAILAGLDPQHLENPSIEDLVHRPSFPGSMITTDGKYGYYLPRSTPVYAARQTVGYLRRIDLLVNPPRVVRTSSEPQPSLRARVAAVSEVAGLLFVVEEKSGGPIAEVLPSQQIKVFQTSTLTAAPDIRVSIDDCDLGTCTLFFRHTSRRISACQLTTATASQRVLMASICTRSISHSAECLLWILELGRRLRLFEMLAIVRRS